MRNPRGEEGDTPQGGEEADLWAIHKCIPSVLRLAHTHQLGAHLGVEKTLERIKAWFYWPGVKKTVEDYCRSCPECQ